MSKETQLNSVNPFREAREQAKLSMLEASIILSGLWVGSVYYERWSAINKLESTKHPYPIPVWSHKYLSELRRIAFENEAKEK